MPKVDRPDGEAMAESAAKAVVRATPGAAMAERTRTPETDVRSSNTAGVFKVQYTKSLPASRLGISRDQFFRHRTLHQFLPIA